MHLSKTSKAPNVRPEFLALQKATEALSRTLVEYEQALKDAKSAAKIQQKFKK